MGTQNQNLQGEEQPLSLTHPETQSGLTRWLPPEVWEEMPQLLAGNLCFGAEAVL